MVIMKRKKYALHVNSESLLALYSYRVNLELYSKVGMDIICCHIGRTLRAPACVPLKRLVSCLQLRHRPEPRLVIFPSASEPRSPSIGRAKQGRDP